VPNAFTDIFRKAAELNRGDPLRKGNLVELEGPAQVLVAGDIHGNRAGLAKIIAHAAVGSSENRRLVLQEVIHGPPDPRTGHDRSIELLVRVARLKIAAPSRVFFVLGNHDLAQATGSEVTKEGRGVCKAFAAGVEAACPGAGTEVLEAAKGFLLSMPLAIRLPNRVWISHSLPSPRRMELAGVEIFARQVRPEDLLRGGAVYEWTWGRDQTPEQIDALAAALGVDFFILGHKHTRRGWDMLSPRALVLGCDHDRGCVMEFSTDAVLTADNAAGFVRPLAGLGVQG